MKERKQILYIIQGFIGAGKTTFSKKLSRDTGAIRLNADEWVVEHFSESEYNLDWNTCFDKAVSTLWGEAEKYLRAGQDVIFDMGFWKKQDRDFARDFAGRLGAECKHYYLYVPDEILKQRIINARPEEWAKKHLQNFDKNKSAFEEPKEDEDFIKINNF